MVVTRMVVRGTHTGDFRGIAPSGRQVAVDAVNISRLVEGRVVEEWVNFDAMGLLRQLGALPLPAPAEV